MRDEMICFFEKPGYTSAYNTEVTDAVLVDVFKTALEAKKSIKSTEPALNSNVFNFSQMRKIKKRLPSKMIFLIVNFCEKRKIFFENKLKTINFYSVIYYNQNKFLN